MLLLWVEGVNLVCSRLSLKTHNFKCFLWKKASHPTCYSRNLKKWREIRQPIPYATQWIMKPFIIQMHPVWVQKIFQKWGLHKDTLSLLLRGTSYILDVWYSLNTNPFLSLFKVRTHGLSLNRLVCLSLSSDLKQQLTA